MTRARARVSARAGSRGQNGRSKRKEKVILNNEVGFTPQPSETPRSHGLTTTPELTPNTQPTVEQVNIEPTAVSEYILFVMTLLEIISIRT